MAASGSFRPFAARSINDGFGVGTGHWPAEATRNFAADMLPRRRKAALSPNFQIAISQLKSAFGVRRRHPNALPI